MIMRVAVAGGSGFIGRHVVEALRDAGHRARVLARRVDASQDDEHVEFRAVDVGAGPLAPDVLRGCDAVVNLVGIKAAHGDNSFARAHVDAVANLIDAARVAGIERFVHISVAQTTDASGPYAQTKSDGEARARDGGLATTVLRPGLVYGPGDDALRNLVRMVVVAPVVPLPSGATGPLPAIDVRDVALGVVATLERPQTAGQTIDLVGPEPLHLRALVQRVADALELRTFTPTVPSALAQVGAAMMERVSSDPLLSRSQLAMLRKGLPGDPTRAADLLDLHPRPLSSARIRELAAEIPPLLPSVRLIPSIESRRWVQERATELSRWPWLLALAMLLMLTGPSVLPSVWTRMAAINTALFIAVVLTSRAALGPLLRPRIGGVALGLGLALGLYVGADVFMAGLRVVAPALALQVQEVYGWSALASETTRLALLPLIVFGEDLVWRGVVTFPLVARLGPTVGCLAAGMLFAAAHLTTGPPLLLLAALVMGTLWSAIAIRTRSLVPVFISHWVWDLAVMFVRPL